MTDINYKFNDGRGAVLCRKCRVILATDLSYAMAVLRWTGRDKCIKCTRDVLSKEAAKCRHQ